MTEAEQNYQRATELVAFLNEAVEADREAIQLLTRQWAFCNAKLADHPNIQVSSHYGKQTVGMVGILCGLSERMYGLKVCSASDDKNNLIRFAILKDVCSPTS